MSIPLPDRQPFQAYLDRHYEAIYNYLCRLVRDRVAAEDITQEAFMKAWLNFSKFDQGRDFKPWIFRLAHNLAVDHMRRHRETPATLESHNMMEPARQEEALTKQATMQALEKEMENLPALQQTVLHLYYIEELRLPEISRITGKSKRALISCLQRARATLRKKLVL